MTREYMINMIILYTGWTESVFDKLSDHEILKLYMERVEKNTDVSG